MDELEGMHTRRVLEPAAWILQMVSGLLLAALIAIHLYVTHFSTHDALAYENVVERFRDAGFKAIYTLLLLAVTFHAFNGVRAIVLDTDFGAKNRRAVNWLLMLLFVAAFAYGILLMSSV
jgi:succinate dehydrogenase / fumarate reductase membrane anchor subunit